MTKLKRLEKRRLANFLGYKMLAGTITKEEKKRLMQLSEELNPGFWREIKNA